MFTIKIGTLPGPAPTEYIFEAPVSVRDMLSTAGVSGSGKVIKLNGVVVNLDTVVGTVADGGLLVVTAQIKGN